ncbi:hypothetical protein DYB30_013463, partial [Aphanomyces astaci]
RRQDEFQKALTYLRDCYTQELDVARAQVTNDANETLHGEAEKNVLSWEDWTRELEQQLSLKWELRPPGGPPSACRSPVPGPEGCETGSRSALPEGPSASRRPPSVQEALRAALGDLSFRESANVVCGSCPILEKEKQDLREALQEWERSLMEEVQRRQGMERVWEEEHRRLLESEETTRELQESIQTEQNRYEQTLLSEQGRRQDLEQLVQEQFITLTQERTQSGEDPSPWTRDQLERERHANEEVLYQVEEAHTCLETEKLKLWDQEATSWNWTEWG